MEYNRLPLQSHIHHLQSQEDSNRRQHIVAIVKNIITPIPNSLIEIQTEDT
jgi:hypothetical protein